MSKNHYVYYSYEEWGRGYIGVRSTKLDPREDPYMGSFKDKSFKPTRKEIIATFESRKKALEAEIILHNFYEVHLNPHFANKAKQTSTGFNTQGVLPEKNPMFGKKAENNPNYGKKWFTDGKKDIYSFECPQGFFLGRSSYKGTNNKMYGKRGKENPNSKLKWFTNGIEEIRTIECPLGFRKGRIKNNLWFTNGEKNIFTTTCPDGFRRGRTILNKHDNFFYKSTKKELHPFFGKKWFNNGKINVITFECPEGFKPGLLRRSRMKFKD